MRDVGRVFAGWVKTSLGNRRSDSLSRRTRLIFTNRQLGVGQEGACGQQCDRRSFCSQWRAPGRCLLSPTRGWSHFLTAEEKVFSTDTASPGLRTGISLHGNQARSAGRRYCPIQERARLWVLRVRPNSGRLPRTRSCTWDQSDPQQPCSSIPGVGFARRYFRTSIRSAGTCIWTFASRLRFRYRRPSDTGEAERQEYVPPNWSIRTHRAEWEVVGCSMVDGRAGSGKTGS